MNPASPRISACAVRLVLAMLLSAGEVGFSAESPATLPASAQPVRGRPARVQAETFFNQGMIPRLHIEIAPPEMESLRRQPRVFVRATIREVAPGQADWVYSDVAVHVKGYIGSLRSVDDKPALTADFAKNVKGRRFHGLKKIHLNNSVQDPSYLCENIGGGIFRAAGVPAPRVTNARVWLNGRDLGFYALVEGIDEVFLRNYFSDSSGAIYQASCREPDQIEPGPRRKDVSPLKQLVAAANERDPAARRRRIGKLLDVDRFVSFAAIEAMIVHWDGYCGNRNNYFIYADPATCRLNFIPHGMDQLFQRPGEGLFYGAGVVARAVAENPEDRLDYYDRVAELRQRVLDPEALCRRIDQITARTLPALEEISPQAAREHRRLADDLRRRIVERIRNIDQQLAAMPKPLRFDSTGVALVSNWHPQIDGGKATIERSEDDGKPIWRIRIAEGNPAASLRSRVLLTKGKYAFEAQCRTIAVKAGDGANTAAGLRISGGQRTTRLAGDSPWQKTNFQFEINEPSREVTLVCELRATAGEAQFQAASLTLRRQ